MNRNQKVALLTGATGFIGKSVLKRLLTDSEEWTVIVMVRPKILTRTASGKRIRRKKNAKPASSEERMKTLVAYLGIPKEETHRLHYIESEIDPSLDPQILYEAVKEEMVRHGSTSPPLRLDLVIHMAASLQQESEDMPSEKVERIRKRNQDVNVQGLRMLLSSIERFGTPEKVRILRPSIVCGKGSRTGFMATFNYFGNWWHRALGILFFYFQKTIPTIGNPDAIMDVIDIQDVVGAIMDLVHLDCGEEETTQSGLGSVYYMSTSYVHGKRAGLLKEEPVYIKPDQDYHNSYEETKATAENVVDGWAARLSGEETLCTYHNITNENAPTLKEMNDIIYKYFGVPSFANKLVYCSDKDAFIASFKDIRPRMAGRYGEKFWKYINVLAPYTLRDGCTRFDCSTTTSILGHPIATTKISADYFRSIL